MVKGAGGIPGVQFLVSRMVGKLVGRASGEVPEGQVPTVNKSVLEGGPGDGWMGPGSEAKSGKHVIEGEIVLTMFDRMASEV